VGLLTMGRVEGVSESVPFVLLENLLWKEVGYAEEESGNCTETYLSSSQKGI